MLSVAVHKDIAEYQPKIIGKLTLRTLLCIVCAVGISLIVGLYLYFVLGFDPTDFEVLILAISMPFWAMGFWRDIRQVLDRVQLHQEEYFPHPLVQAHGICGAKRREKGSQGI